MLKAIWQFIRFLLAGGLFTYGVTHEVVATSGDLGFQQILNILTWVVAAAGAWFGTSGGVVDRLKAFWAWIQRNPFPRLSKASDMRNMVMETVAAFKHVPTARREALLKEADEFCRCAALHQPEVKP